jgi:hypothetical protein
MPLATVTKYYVRIKRYSYRLYETYDTIEDAQAAIDSQSVPDDWYIVPEIVYVTV